MKFEKTVWFGMTTFTIGLVSGAVLLGCASMQQTVKTVKDSVQLVDDACVIIHDIAPDNKAGQDVCAREEELRPYIKFILGGRARAAAARLDAGSTPDTSNSK